MSDCSQTSSVLSSEEDEAHEKIKSKKTTIVIAPSQAPTPNARITINLTLTHYDVIEEVAEELGWKIQRSMKAGNIWDVLWTDHHIQPDLLIRMQLYQKVSHFPGIHVLSRKNLLGLSFMDMAKRAPEHYNFFPRTWLLPAQYSELRKQFNGEEKTFIVKPQADCQGRGIFLTQKVEEVENGQHYVVQQYISRPFLVEGLKFDFRVYVLLCGVSPMRIYIYEEGLARFATQPYIPPNKNNLKKQYIHLTNYAINKRNPKFIYNSSNQRMDVGHKRALTSVLKLIEKRGYDLQAVKNNINDAIVKTLLLGHPLVAHQYRFCQPHDEQRNMCFHLLGIDVMLDADCRPYVLEVNHTPSFVTDTPLDYHIKYALIKDTLTLMNITPQSRAEALDRVAKIKSERNMKRQKRQLYENADKQERVKAAQEERNRVEDQNIGKFTRIYPLADREKMDIYEELLDLAEKSYFSQSNVLRAQMQKEKASQQANTKDKQEKVKKTIYDEVVSPGKGKKILSTSDHIGSDVDRNPDSPLRQMKRDRLGSFAESKSRKFNGIELKEIEQELLPIRPKNDLKSSNTIKYPQTIVAKQSHPKTLPKIINDSSPVKFQNQYVAYRKKKVQLIKQRQEDRQRDDSAKDPKILKEILISSKPKLQRKDREDESQEDDD